MKVWVKDFYVTMDVKNNGVEFSIDRDGGKGHRGDLFVTKTGLTWCDGRTPRKNGKRISWDDFIERMNKRN